MTDGKFSITMTIRGVLFAGKWSTQNDMNLMSYDDKKTLLATQVSTYLSPSLSYFQAFKDDDLIGIGAIVVFVREAFSDTITDDQLKTWDDKAARDFITWHNSARTDDSIASMAAMSNKDLVQKALGWYSNAKAVSAVLDLTWDIDNGKVLSAAPDVVASETLDNRKSTVPLKSNFSFEESISNTSSFSEDHGFDVSAGVETTISVGVPLIASGEATVSVSATQTNNWTFGKENTTTQTYSHSSDVEVPVGKQIKITAQITRAEMVVPYSATIRTGDGSIHTITGVWNGVATANLFVKQEDIV